MTHIPTCTCHLCGWRMPIGEIAPHLAERHGIDSTAPGSFWPDGDPVIIDTTIEPEDFA